MFATAPAIRLALALLLALAFCPDALSEHKPEAAADESADTRRVLPTGKIRGVVRDQNGRPVANALVIVNRWHSRGKVRLHPNTVRTDKHGRYEIEVVFERGRRMTVNTISAVAPGHPRSQKHGPFVLKAGGVVGVDFRVGR